MSSSFSLVRVRFAGLVFSGLVVVGLVPPFAAQAAPAVETYPAAFFAPYAPLTALDMVQHLPGFRLDLGDSGVRGFSGAGGNVLIDGERPAGKSGGLAAALSAIPARQVARIQILRDGAGGSETAGQGVVANIVHAKSDGGLAAEASLSSVNGLGGASLTATRRVAGFEIGAKTTFDAAGERSHGTRAHFDAAGASTGLDALTYRTDFPELSQRLTLGGPVAGGQVKAAAMLARARLAEGFAFDSRTVIDRFPKRTGRWRGEASADWTRGLAGDYALKLLALVNFTDLDARSLSQTETDSGPVKATDSFESRGASRETILRVALAEGGAAKWRSELGAEVAWNSLDSRSAFTTFDDAGVATSRSTTDARVSETRLEVFTTLDWRPAPRWTVVAGVAYESSWIQVQGEGSSRNRFGFLKPRLTGAYKLDDRSDLRLSLRRTVGQLSFGDFAASANLAEGTASGGNADLGPDHRTTAALDYDRRFGGRGAFTFSAAYDWRRDVLEAAVLPSGAFGVVNVDRARAWSVAANLELPVDQYVPGGVLKLGYGRSGSRIADPLTGARRALNGSHPVDFTASFRQDIASVQASWGVDYARRVDTGFWYVDEARALRRAPQLDLFVETSRFLSAKLRLDLKGLSGTRNTYRRVLFSPDRSGAPSGGETWDIRTPRVVTVSVSRGF